jgi:hypothetical protein
LLSIHCPVKIVIVKYRQRFREAQVLLAACLWLVPAFFEVQAKVIRLRNETITTEPRIGGATAKTPLTSQLLNGLYLIQFNSPPSAEVRAQLSAAGVDLLHYIPEDAFVARCRSARADQLRAMPFITWLGDYRPDHKVHANVRTKAIEKPTESLDLTVLMVPRATVAEIAAVRGYMSAIRQQSTIRSGTVIRGTIDAAQLDGLAGSDLVLWIEPAPRMKLVDEVASKIVAGDGGTKQLLTQSLGYDGAGVNVAVADTGLNNGDAATMHPDLKGRTPAFF